MKVMMHFLLWRFGLAKGETQTSDAERICLAKYAVGKKRLVEIGVWHGVTTSVLRKAMVPDGVLYGVDPFPEGRFMFSAQQIIAHKEVARIENGKVEWVRLKATEAAKAHVIDGREPVDFIFIDGDHSYEGLKGDWEAWSPLVAPQGIVALHDSRSSSTQKIDDAGSVRFTGEVILNDSRFEEVEAVDTLTVLKRKRSGV